MPGQRRTTASDLARFAIGIQQAMAGKSNPVISQSMTRQMLTVQKGNSGLGLGLGGSGKTLSHCQMCATEAPRQGSSTTQ